LDICLWKTFASVLVRDLKKLAVTISNSSTGSLDVSGSSLPHTTKSNKRHHGIGMESIRYSLAQYGGFFTYELIDGKFSLKLMIPTDPKTLGTPGASRP